MKQFDFKKQTILLVLVSFLTLFFVVTFFFSIYILERGQVVKKIAEAPPVPKTTLPNPFQNVSLQARAVYVFDVRTGKVLFARNEESRLPLASLTKVMTAYVASDMPEDTVVFFDDGEKWSLKELLEYTLVVSSNSGASAIAGAGGAWFSVGRKEDDMSDTDVFVKKMNEEASALSLAETHFSNPNGLDISDTLSGAYGSAKDMALLFAHILKNKPTLMEATTYDSLRFSSLDGTSHVAENTNIIARTTPGLLASKTGYTDLAGGNLAIAFNVGPAHPVVAVVLGSTQMGRFSDMEKLLAASVKRVGQGE